MAVGFDTPLGGLALEMAYRNEQARKKAEEQGAYEKSLVGRRIMGTGDSIDNYQNVWDRGYAGTAAASQAQAGALRDYWVGLPELMIAAAKEGQSTGGGGGTSSQTPYPTTPSTPATSYVPSQYTPSLAVRPSPDVLDRPRARPKTGGTIRARRLTPITVRQGR